MHAFSHRHVQAICDSLEASGRGSFSSLIEIVSMAVRYATYPRTSDYDKLKLVFAGHAIYMNLYRLDRVTGGNNKNKLKQIDGTMKFENSSKIIPKLNHMDFCLHAFPYQLEADISLGGSTEMHHEKSELFRTSCLWVLTFCALVLHVVNTLHS